MLVNVGAANVDPAEFADPMDVRFDRDVNRHLAFGGGVHRCLGSHLARRELRVTLREWHRRIPEYSIKPGVELHVCRRPPPGREPGAGLADQVSAEVVERRFQDTPALELRSGALRATFVPGVGMTGVSLRYERREYLALPGGVAAVRAGHTGGLPLLAPWVNRLGRAVPRRRGRRRPPSLKLTPTSTGCRSTACSSAGPSGR